MKKISENRRRCNFFAGQITKEIRSQKGMTQGELAKKVNCSSSNITQFETRGIDSVGVIFDLCEAMNIDIATFFGMLSSMLEKNPILSTPKSIKSTLREEIKNICKRENVVAKITVTVLNK